MVQLKMSQHLFKQWVGVEQAISHYLNQWGPSVQRHICVTGPQRVNTLYPADASSRPWSYVVYAVVCRMFGVKPLQKSVTTFYEFCINPMYHIQYWYNLMYTNAFEKTSITHGHAHSGLTLAVVIAWQILHERLFIQNVC